MLRRGAIAITSTQRAAGPADRHGAYTAPLENRHRSLMKPQGGMFLFGEPAARTGLRQGVARGITRRCSACPRQCVQLKPNSGSISALQRGAMSVAEDF